MGDGSDGKLELVYSASDAPGYDGKVGIWGASSHKLLAILEYSSTDDTAWRYTLRRLYEHTPGTADYVAQLTHSTEGDRESGQLLWLESDWVRFDHRRLIQVEKSPGRTTTLYVSTEHFPDGTLVSVPPDSWALDHFAVVYDTSKLSTPTTLLWVGARPAFGWEAKEWVGGLYTKDQGCVAWTDAATYTDEVVANEHPGFPLPSTARAVNSAISYWSLKGLEFNAQTLVPIYADQS